MIWIDIYTRERVSPEIAKKATAAALEFDESKISMVEQLNLHVPGVYILSRAIDWDVETFSWEHTIEDPTAISNYPETWTADMKRDVTDLVFARVWSKVAGVDVLAQVRIFPDEDEWFVVHPDGTEELFEMPEEEEDDWDEEEGETSKAEEKA